MKLKSWVWILVALIVIGIGYYLLSPLFRVVEVEEASPLAFDKPETVTVEASPGVFIEMSPEEKAEMDRLHEESEKQRQDDMDDTMPTSPQLIAQGTFMQSGSHTVEGKALLIEGRGSRTLRFEDFYTVNGPDLRVYLATDMKGTDFVEVSKLKGTKGNINYEIDSSIDIEKYKYVLVWCKPFGILFSYAILE